VRVMKSRYLGAFCTKRAAASRTPEAMWDNYLENRWSAEPVDVSGKCQPQRQNAALAALLMQR
jgi:hypothetical protein